MKNNEKKVESRRNFVKKVAYAVPAIVALGQLTSPVNASAAANSKIKGNPNASISTTTTVVNS